MGKYDIHDKIAIYATHVKQSSSPIYKLYITKQRDIYYQFLDKRHTMHNKIEKILE